MAAKLITLPLRVWVRSARLLTCAATGTAGWAFSLIQHPRAGDRDPGEERGAPAEPGAEEGADADVTVLEPWNGYAHMNAREVIARARQADSAELAAMRLYESRHRRRQTVLAAVDRQLKLSLGGAPA